jgi:hypothetical protein
MDRCDECDAELVVGPGGGIECPNNKCPHNLKIMESMKGLKRLNDAAILDQISGQYEKFLLAVLRKYHPQGVRITLADLEKLVAETAGPDPIVLFTHGHKESIEFKAMRASDAKRVAAHVGGQTKQGRPA